MIDVHASTVCAPYPYNRTLTSTAVTAYLYYCRHVTDGGGAIRAFGEVYSYIKLQTLALTVTFRANISYNC
jgi:hypothetical protein